MCVILGGAAVFMALVFWGAYAMDAASCKRKWLESGFQSRYYIIGGCQIKYQGRWIPEERYRVVE